MTTTPMYSLRTEGSGHRITKFVDGEVESSYSVSFDACECPAGHRHTCRHRQMLPTMLAHGIADTHWFYLHDRAGAIVDFNGTSKHLLDQLAESQPVGAAQHAEPSRDPLDAMFNELANIPGVQVLGMDNLLAVHNAIADAVSEPEARIADLTQIVPNTEPDILTDLPPNHSARSGHVIGRMSAKPWRRM